MSVDVKLSSVQRQVEENAKKAGRLGRRMVMAALGVAGYTYDTGISVCHGAEDCFHKAEVRGEKVETHINSRASQVQEQLTDEAKSRRAKVEDALSGITDGVGETGKSIEQAFQSKLASLKIGDGTVMETDQIKIEVEVIDQQPFENYDALNAQEIINGLNRLEKDKLQEAYDYEKSSKNRITVLREIELLQAALEEEPAADESGEAEEESES